MEQSLITIAITSIAIFSIVSVLSVFTTIKDGIRLSNERIGADIMILPIKSNEKYISSLYTAEPSNNYIMIDDIKFLNRYSEIENTTYQFFTNTIEDSCCSVGEKARIVGFDQNTDFILKPWLEQNGIKLINENQAIIGKDIFSIVGNKMRILKHDFNIVGSLYKTGSGLDRTIFVDIKSARKLALDNPENQLFKKINPNKLVSSILIKVHPKTNIESLVYKINSYQDKVVAVSKAASIEHIESQISGLSYVGILLTVALIISSIISLFARFNTLANSRKKEIGYLRILGIKKINILKLITYEICIMAVIGGCIGTIFSVISTPFIINNLQLYFTLPVGSITFIGIFNHFVIGIFSAILLGIVSGLIPAINITRLDPQEIMSKGEL
ncbi:ABC transporter permease [uncultured Clostridium sp.]|uniref:ABC transporter permease n=1 Tax=uncultured Clostridium sp. TaxID=59620 RepID=UPI00258DF786|nr:ABC transporter permease [uncultured Clostridium sp.]